MREIELSKINYVGQMYFLAKPEGVVRIYHSYKELMDNEKDVIILSSLGNLLDYIHRNYKDIIVGSKPFLIRDNVWIKTIDEYVPNYIDQNMEIVYDLDKEGNKIPTDGCYINLLFYRSSTHFIELGTSAGMFYVNYKRWKVTAATPYDNNFNRDYIHHLQFKKYAPESRLTRLVRKNKSNITLIKFAMAYLIPTSETYLDIKKSFTMHLSKTYRVKDLDQIIKSKSFRESVMTVLKVVYPSLATKIRDSYTPDKIIEMINEMWNLSKENKDVKGMLDIFKNIISYGYTEETTVSKPLVNELPNLPKIDIISDTGDNKNEEIEYHLQGTKKLLDYPESFVMSDYTDEYPEE